MSTYCFVCRVVCGEAGGLPFRQYAIKRLLRPSVAGYSFIVVSAVLLAIGVG